MDRRSFLHGALAMAGTAWAVPPAQAAPELSADLKDQLLTMQYGQRPVLTYRHGQTSQPAGLSPLFARSGYLHPLHAPNGALVTDDFPSDHPHQRGVFFAWTKTAVGDLKPDFWNLGSGLGRIRSVKLDARAETGKPVHFEAVHLWEMKQGREWTAVLDEVWSVVVHPPTFSDAEAPDAAYVIDLTSRQTPRLDLELVKHIYGGMAVRGSREWLGPNAGMRVLTSEGKDRVGANASRARWVDLSGPVAGKTAGIALLEHPSVLRAPNRLRVHSDVPYAVFAVPQEEPYVLQAGKSYLFRYRLVAHNGLANAAQLDRLWTEFSQVP